MSMRTQILEQVHSVAVLPAAVAEAICLLQDPESTTMQITRVIELDPGLTSNVLRMANSAYYGSTGSVDSVKLAITRLGRSPMLRMLLDSAVAPVLQKPVNGYHLPAGELWENSVMVATTAMQLGQALSMNPPPHTFTCGMLHDIGKIVLGSFVEVDAKPILNLAFEEGLSFELAEQRVLGIDHAETGAELLKYWKLPSSVVEVVRWHHQPDAYPEQDTAVVDLVHTADLLVTISGIGSGAAGSNYQPSLQSTTRLNIKPAMAEQVLCRAMGQLDEARELFAA